jgi:hypothetical protein
MLDFRKRILHHLNLVTNLNAVGQKKNHYHPYSTNKTKWNKEELGILLRISYLIKDKGGV